MSSPLPLERLVRSSDFVRALGAPQRARSVHFAVHFVPTGPSRPRRVVVRELSTGSAPIATKPVDDFLPATGCWLGAVVPKRHARRAVTRTLLKRQIREAARRHLTGMAPGLWVVRLRAPFDKKQFVSAASDVLRAMARCELDTLMTRASSARG